MRAACRALKRGFKQKGKVKRKVYSARFIELENLDKMQDDVKEGVRVQEEHGEGEQKGEEGRGRGE